VGPLRDRYVQPSRLAAGCTAVVYYSTASLPLIAVSEVYWPSSRLIAVGLWLAAAAVLSLPWLMCWTRRAELRPWAATAAML